MTNSNQEFYKEQRKDLLMVDPRLIVTNENDNIREDYGNIEELSESIIENGVKVALRGYRDGENFIVTDGFRRSRAIKLALEKGIEIARVPFLLEPKGYTKEQRILDMFIMNDGKRLTPLEEGKLFLKLENDYGFTRKEIAKKTGRTEGHISQMIQLQDAPQEAKEAIKDGKISASTVRKVVANTKNQEEAKEAVSKAIEKAQSEGKKKATESDVDNSLIKPNNIGSNKDVKLLKLKDLLIESSSRGINTERLDTAQMIYEFLSNRMLTESMIQYLEGKSIIPSGKVIEKTSAMS
jgi:ParB/RepB/Spo0J family partition protein